MKWVRMVVEDDDGDWSCEQTEMQRYSRSLPSLISLGISSHSQLAQVSDQMVCKIRRRFTSVPSLRSPLFRLPPTTTDFLPRIHPQCLCEPSPCAFLSCMTFVCLSFPIVRPLLQSSLFSSTHLPSIAVWNLPSLHCCHLCIFPTHYSLHFLPCILFLALFTQHSFISNHARTHRRLSIAFRTRPKRGVRACPAYLVALRFWRLQLVHRYSNVPYTSLRSRTDSLRQHHYTTFLPRYPYLDITITTSNLQHLYRIFPTLYQQYHYNIATSGSQTMYQICYDPFRS